MSSFFQELFQSDFLRNALIAGFLTSIACGIVGALTVVNRLAYAAGGIAHSSLGGIGVALLLGFSPIWGALFASLLAALIVSWITLKYQEKSDTAISAVWSLGMAIGILCIYQVDGYTVDPMTYLFGNILLVPHRDLILVALLDLLVVATVVILYRPLLIISFDRELAKIRGLPVEVLHIVMMLLLALTITALIQVVGLLMMIALLTLPAAIASRVTKSLSTMMIAGALIGIFSTFFGLLLSWWIDLPSGAIIIIFITLLYFASLLIPQRISPGG